MNKCVQGVLYAFAVMNLLYACDPHEVQEADAEAMAAALGTAAQPSTAAAPGSDVPQPSVAQRLAGVSSHNAAVASALRIWEQRSQEVRDSEAVHDSDLGASK